MRSTSVGEFARGRPIILMALTAVSVLGLFLFRGNMFVSDAEIKERVERQVVTCDGEAMTPGEVCFSIKGGSLTYESMRNDEGDERLNAAVKGWGGLALFTGGGAWGMILYRAERRRQRLLKPRNSVCLTTQPLWVVFFLHLVGVVGCIGIAAVVGSMTSHVTFNVAVRVFVTLICFGLIGRVAYRMANYVAGPPGYIDLLPRLHRSVTGGLAMVPILGVPASFVAGAFNPEWTTFLRGLGIH